MSFMSIEDASRSAPGAGNLHSCLEAAVLSVLLSTHVVAAEPPQTAASTLSSIPDQDRVIRYRSATIDGFKIFYREAGDPKRPAILLLHGFSSSSHMFRDLMPLLADRFHLIAPDYPGFGYSDAPLATAFEPNFERLTEVTEKFVQTVGLKSFVIYMQDFGGPVGFRMAVKHPEWVSGLIVQNANAYQEGLSPEQLKGMGNPKQSTSARVVTPEFIQYMYRNGARDVSGLNPDAWTVDIAALQRPDAKRIQAALIDDYPSNLQLYSAWQTYLRKRQPKTLIVWGKNDRGFLSAGAEAYRRDLRDVELKYFDTGHFALEEDAADIARAIVQSFAPK